MRVGIGVKQVMRVFPQKTGYTPDDAFAFAGLPPLDIPEHGEPTIRDYSTSPDCGICDNCYGQLCREGKTV